MRVSPLSRNDCPFQGLLHPHYGVRRMEARASPALRVRAMQGIKFYSHRCQHWLIRPDAVVWPRGTFRLFTAPCLLHAGRRWSALKSSNKVILPVRRSIHPESQSRLDGVWPKQWANYLLHVCSLRRQHRSARIVPRHDANMC